MTSAFVVSLLLTLVPGTPSPARGWAHAPTQAPRDTPPPVIENARRERELRALIANGGATPDLYMELAALMNRVGRFDDTIQALRGAAALEPGAAEPLHRIAVFFWDKARGDSTLAAAQKQAYIQQGLDAEDRALALQPDYMEALTYKNILLRLKANGSTDPVEQKRLVDEADGLRNRVIDMQRATPAPSAPRAMDAPPPPPFIGFAEPYEQTLARLQPLRVGANVRTPTKIKDVKPVFPEEAKAARVQGVVIIEALIDDNGDVANARILRSIPMLDEAALGAVSQWRFTATDVNGQRTALLMTVTVNFTLVE